MQKADKTIWTDQTQVREENKKIRLKDIMEGVISIQTK